MKNSKLASVPTIKRLPSYLHVIEAAHKEGREYISGTVIAEELELEPIQVRKDLALTGVVGRPRLGFRVEDLITAINAFLQWNQVRRAVVVGAGNLGTALMGYGEFARHGMEIVAACDADPRKAGSSVNGRRVIPPSELPSFVKRENVTLAILTVPSSAAQETAETLVAAGITAIWNFTNVKLKLPPEVIVQKEDLSSGYAVLSVKLSRAVT